MTTLLYVTTSFITRGTGVALYDFMSRDNEELTLTEGETVYVTWEDEQTIWYQVGNTGNISPNRSFDVHSYIQ